MFQYEPRDVVEDDDPLKVQPDTTHTSIGKGRISKNQKCTACCQNGHNHHNIQSCATLTSSQPTSTKIIGKFNLFVTTTYDS